MLLQGETVLFRLCFSLPRAACQHAYACLHVRLPAILITCARGVLRHNLFLDAVFQAGRKMPAKRGKRKTAAASSAPPLNLQERIDQHTLGVKLVPVSAIRVLKQFLARKPSTSRWMELSKKMRGQEGWNQAHNLLVVQLPSVRAHTRHTCWNTLHTNTLHTNTYTQTPTGTATIAPSGNADRPIDNRGIRSYAART